MSTPATKLTLAEIESQRSVSDYNSNLHSLSYMLRTLNTELAAAEQLVVGLRAAAEEIRAAEGPDLTGAVVADLRRSLAELAPGVRAALRAWADPDGGSTLIVSGAITADKIQAGAITANRISAGSILASQLHPATRSGLTANSGAVSPGKVTISGDGKLSDWRQGDDSTKISGGAIAPGSVQANTLRLSGV